MNDLVTASAVAVGLIALLSSTNITGSNALSRTADHLPGSAFHELWIMHLFSATTAASAGNIPYAAREWELFEKRLPRFLPVRLRSIVTLIGSSLRGDEQGGYAKQSLPYQMLSYFRGAFDQVDLDALETPELDGRLTHATDAVKHDVARLAETHLTAARTKNPAALVRTSAELAERGLWAPAAYALQEARSIYLRRRATGSVSACDEQLQELERIAHAATGWFSLTSMTSTPKVSLTPRQLEAARLASRGLSNVDLAKQLHCSVRTVESHLSAARAKLGATSRADIAPAMRAHGLS